MEVSKAPIFLETVTISSLSLPIRGRKRNFANLIGAENGVHGLACHLPHAFAGYERLAFLTSGDFLSDFHHKTPHDYREQLLGAFSPISS